MKITLGIDRIAYSSKEQAKANFGRIRNAIRPTEAEPEELLRIITAGQSFTPACLEGTDGESWRSQQIIAADVDNAEEVKDPETGKKVKRMIAHPCTPEQAAESLESLGIDTYVIYRTFSSSEDWPRFRIVVVLDTELLFDTEAQAFSRALNYAIENMPTPGAHKGATDTANADNARLFLGSTPDCIVSAKQKICSAEAFRKLRAWQEHREAEQRQKEAREAAERRKAEAVTAEPVKMPKTGAFDLNRAKESFSLLDYVRRTSGAEEKTIGKNHFFNPCPICGHNNDFAISEDAPHLFTCFSAGGLAGKGGSIIDYLMHAEGLDTAHAIAKFQHEILGYPEITLNRTPSALSEEPPEDPSRPDPEEYRQPIFVPSAAEYMESGLFQEDIKKFIRGADVKTGFELFDGKLGGGLYGGGLYVIGGVPSVGKTTFVLSLANQIAVRRRPVMFFSMEQSRLEIISKSISQNARRMFPSNQDYINTSLEIRLGRMTEKTKEAMKNYQDNFAPYMHIFESDEETNMNTIKNAVDDFVNMSNEVPVVIVDYLQITKPAEEGRSFTDARLATDRIVSELRRIATKYATPVIVISSFNRGNYKASVDFEAFKESGGIEYTADVLIGIEYAAVRDLAKDENTRREQIKKAKAAEPRQVIVSILKNRYGQAFSETEFEYYTKFDFFREKPERKHY